MRHTITFLLVVPAFFFVQGCAGPRLHTDPATQEEAAVVLEAFERFQALGLQACGCCLDAETDIALSVAGWFKNHSAKFFGYLQAMEPGYIRFVATNQLGQPLFLFVSDGLMFSHLNVYQEKAYTGSTASEAYRQFVPPGLTPDFLFSWLTPAPCYQGQPGQGAGGYTLPGVPVPPGFRHHGKSSRAAWAFRAGPGTWRVPFSCQGNRYLQPE
jgi:hypothetical protein